MPDDPDFTIGIEEEYLLVDPGTGALAEAHPDLMAEANERLGPQVSPEFLQCQIEVGTKVCATVAEARDDLSNLRRTVAELAGRHGLAPIAASCHPFSDWRDQRFTDRERYRQLERDLRGVAERMLICGMHVHVGIPDPELRIDLMGQVSYFLPHLLALSGSSPFWQGMDTGLSSYRLTVFDNMPRTGLPPLMANWSEWQRMVDTLTGIGAIEDGTKIWWDLRPSDRFPTLETRICDTCPRIEDTLTLAALIQCTHRMLWRLRCRNQRWRVYDRFLLEENRWRAMRHGVSGGLIDFGRASIVPLPQLVGEWLEMIAEDAEALGCAAEVARARGLAERNATDAQRAVFEEAGGGAAGGRAVVAHLAEAFGTGL